MPYGGSAPGVKAFSVVLNTRKMVWCF